ncbi:MAG: hypothetical protein ACLR67_00555 [Eggerthella lenta]
MDYLNEREPFYERRLLMIGGRWGVRAVDLFVSGDRPRVHPFNGGRASEMDAVMGQLRGLRTFVNVFAASERKST